MELTRRNLLAKLAFAAAAPIVLPAPARAISYFFAPKGGWHRAQLTDGFVEFRVLEETWLQHDGDWDKVIYSIDPVETPFASVATGKAEMSIHEWTNDILTINGKPKYIRAGKNNAELLRRIAGR